MFAAGIFVLIGQFAALVWPLLSLPVVIGTIGMIKWRSDPMTALIGAMVQACEWPFGTRNEANEFEHDQS